VTVNNFTMKIQNGKPNVIGVLFKSQVSATTPYVGHTMYLAPPLTRVADFHLDASGNATVPIPILPGMVGVPAYYQAIFRDALAPGALGVTNGVHVDYCY